MNIKMQNHKVTTKEWKSYNKTQKGVIKEELKMMLIGGFLYRICSDKVKIDENDNKETGIHELLASVESSDLIQAIVEADVKHKQKEAEKNVE